MAYLKAPNRGRKLSQRRMTHEEVLTLERLLGTMVQNMDEALQTEQSKPEERVCRPVTVR
jgi:hypothetical protein